MEPSLETLKEIPVWQAALFAVIGMAFCFAGYRILLALSHVYCAVLFGSFGFALGGAAGNPWISVGLALILAALGFFLGRAYLWVNIVLTGLIGGAAAGWLAGELLGMGGNVWPIALGTGVLGAVSIFFQRHIMIAATAAVGGVMIGIATAASLNSMGLLPVGEYLYVHLGFTALLLFAGAVTQHRFSPDVSDPLRRLDESRRRSSP